MKVNPILITAVCLLAVSCSGAYNPQYSGSLSADLQKVLDRHAARDHRVGLGFSYSSPENGSISLVSG